MVTYAGSTLMGSQPVAGRARSMHACVSQRSLATSAHRAWHLAKPAAIRMFVAVPDTNGTTRWPWGPS